MANRPKPLLLPILDGFGLRKDCDNNTIALAIISRRNSLQQNHPMTAPDCSGNLAGLPGDQIGNSKAGLLHIGCDLLLRQRSSRGSHEIAESSFFNNPILCFAADEILRKIVGVISRVSGQTFQAEDRGNIEQMTNPETSQHHTAHTTKPVPPAHFGSAKPLFDGDKQADLAPTMPASLGLTQPAEMSGYSLIGQQ